jgi:tetratricopeptide (TPR) repeat protein
VLEGAVQLADDKVRVTVSLSDSSIGEVVWAESYDRVLEDIFEIQDEITTEIATALEVHLNDVTSDLLAWWEALPNWQVREKALRGISHLYKGSRHDNERARREFSEIIEIMPDQGQGLALVALTHWLDILRGWTDSKSQSIRIATELAERAVQQGDPDGFGRLVLGYARLHQRRHDEAVSLSESATVRRFSCPIARAVYADVLLYSGRPEDAIDEIKYAIRVQRAYPPWMVNVLAEAYRNVGQINPSISVVQESLRLDERNLDARAILCTDYGLSQLSGDARQVARDILRTKPDFTIAGYMKTKPYRETARIDAISSTLREAGLS